MELRDLETRRPWAVASRARYYTVAHWYTPQRAPEPPMRILEPAAGNYQQYCGCRVRQPAVLRVITRCGLQDKTSSGGSGAHCMRGIPMGHGTTKGLRVSKSRTVFHTIRQNLSLFDILVFFSKTMYTMDVYYQYYKLDRCKSVCVCVCLSVTDVTSLPQRVLWERGYNVYRNAYAGNESPS